ncbi:MAG: hypothetical protein CMM84_02395 [Rhodothermaceae bacterium]|nr:hypothetical protein [Rhodothermaceae bacterium]
MRLLVLLAALAPAVALAQSPAPPDSTEAASTDTTATASARPLFSFAALSDSVRARQPAEPEPKPEPTAAPLTPTLHVVGTAGVTMLLPAGWDGPVSAVETEDPGYALYSARNDAPDHLLAGAVLRVERITGLNPLLRERFTRGQTSYGYHGTAPVGPAAVPDGLGIEVAGPGTGGAVAFITRGPILWAVSVQAPATTWAAHRAEVMGLLLSPRLP